MRFSRGACFRWLMVLLLALLATGGAAWAQTGDVGLPDMNLPDIKIDPIPGTKLSPALQTSFLMISLGFIPCFVASCTAFIRVSITLSYLKTALGTGQAISNQVMMGICLMFTFYIMYPVAMRTNEVAVQPYLKGDIEQPDFLVKFAEPIREWMRMQTRQKDLDLFLTFARYKHRPKTLAEYPFVVLYNAFIISEVKTGFMVGFMIYIPFLIIDMIVAATMMSMGMFMISSTTISVPFKLLMWVRLDGWQIVLKGLIYSFNRPDWMGKHPHV